MCSDLEENLHRSTSQKLGKPPSQQVRRFHNFHIQANSGVRRRPNHINQRTNTNTKSNKKTNDCNLYKSNIRPRTHTINLLKSAQTQWFARGNNHTYLFDPTFELRHLLLRVIIDVHLSFKSLRQYQFVNQLLFNVRESWIIEFAWSSHVWSSQ